MANLISTAITPLDSYIEDKAGRSDWAVPDPEVHAFISDLEMEHHRLLRSSNRCG
jgi:hypothetical protein